MAPLPERSPLSESTRGKRWVGNFPPVHRAHAELLLNSVRFASLDDIRWGLTNGIEELLASGSIEFPVLLLANRDVGEMRLPDGFHEHTVFETFQPYGPLLGLPGSEGLVSTVVRDAIKKWPTQLLEAASAESLDSLRNRRLRTIVVVTDYVGSGKQVRDFVATLRRSRRLRSWRSFGWLKVVVLTYAAAEGVDVALQPASFIDRVHVVERANTFASAGWSKEDKTAIEALCLDYGGGRADALGYLGSRGLFASALTIPNNLPYVLRRLGQGWKPLFEGRQVPNDLVSVGGYAPPSIGIREVLVGLHQERAARRLRWTDDSPMSQALVILSALRRGPRNVLALSVSTGLSIRSVSKRLTTLTRLGFVDAERHITVRGVEELNAAKRAPRRLTAGTRGDPTPYYPVVRDEG